MKREILFRGKRVDDDKWVYGYYLGFCAENTNDKHIIISINNAIKYEVIPETVSQFTGLTDKNGVKIFEGDIIKFSTRRYHLNIDKGLQTITFKSDVIFNDGCFIISETQKYDTYLYAFNNESEIIGNIHD